MRRKSSISVATICMALVALLLACNPTTTSPREDWFYFAKAVLERGQNNNVRGIVRDLSMSDLDLANDVMTKFRKANPDLHYEPPNEPPTQAKVDLAYREDVEVFVRSYQDLFDGQLACVANRPKDTKGIESYSVIIWVKKNGKSRGIKIDEVNRTSKGLKVNSWIDSTVNTSSIPNGRLSKKRALLEDDRCGYPERIQYEVVYESQQ